MTVPQHCDTRWRKSRRSEQQGACVELGSSGAIRDSKNPDGPRLTLEVHGLIAAVKENRIR